MAGIARKKSLELYFHCGPILSLRLRIALWVVWSCDYRKLQQFGCTIFASGNLWLCSLSLSLSCFQYEFSVFKALRLKVFKCHNKANNLSSVSVKLFFRSKLTNLATLTIELAVMKINSFQQLRIPTKSKQVSK